MYSSGILPLSTATDAAVELLRLTNHDDDTVTIDNEGAVAGFFSDDGGSTWARLRADAATTFRVRGRNAVIMAKRVAGGANMTGIYAWAS